MIAGNQKLAVVAQNSRDAGDRFRLDKAAPMVPFLRPRVVEQQKEAVDRRCGQPGKQAAGIIVVNADVGQGLRVDP